MSSAGPPGFEPGSRAFLNPLFTGKAAFFRKGLPEAPRISSYPTGPLLLFKFSVAALTA